MNSQIRTFVVFLTICVIALAAAENVSLRILGGYHTPIAKYPYVVFITRDNRPHCTGSIISDQHILTAAHCVAEIPAENLLVITGTNNVLQGGKVHRVKIAYVPSIYQPGVLDNDIGVIVLETKIALTSNSVEKKINFPTGDFRENSDAVVLGFGRSQNVDLEETSPYLKVVSIKIIHAETCRIYLYSVQVVHDGEFCGIQNQGEGSCQGDSGGPLVVNGQVVGVVSHGNNGQNCGFRPDTYTSVLHHIDFIQEVLQKNNYDDLTGFDTFNILNNYPNHFFYV